MLPLLWVQYVQGVEETIKKRRGMERQEGV